jgi:hypothetical protein
MPDYEHDVFISYRRSDDDWVRWTRENFVRALASLLRPGVGKIKIFLDGQIETGTSWPQRLALSHARSKLLVPVLSRDYFQSTWCRVELALMREREKKNNFRTAMNPCGLIFPVVIDDGECFPAEIQEIEGLAFHEFANPFIRSDSPKQEALAGILKTTVCPAIENALKTVPKYNEAWETVSFKNFEKMFQIRTQAQTTVPALKLRRKV